MAGLEAYVETVIAAVGARGGVRTIGINGLDCAGKTTFAKALQVGCAQQGISSTLLHVDDFNEIAVQREVYEAYEASEFTEALLDKYYHFSVNYPALAAAITAEKQRAGQLLIIEGVFLFRPPVADLLDMRVFLSAPIDTARARYAARKVQVNDTRPTEVFDDIWVPAFDRYCGEFDPENTADFTFTM
jgi:uridine kinase